MRTLVALVLAGVAAAVQADSWPAAVATAMASPDGKIVVRVLPGDSLGDVVGFAGAKKGKPARALFYRLEGEDRYAKYQEAELLNPVAPMYFAVSDAGEVVTLDNWHNAGFGKVVVVYAPSGQVRRSYSLADLYSSNELRRAERSTSSIWWRCPYPPLLQARSPGLAVNDRLGNVLAIDLRTGAVSREATHKGC
jgi:hypothetical protein